MPYRPPATNAVLVDKYGDPRTVRFGRQGWKLQRQRSTVAIALNQAVGPLVGKLIRAERQSQGLTLEELCERAGLVSATPKSRMWEIENHIRKEGLRLGTLFALAKALNVEATALLPSVAEVIKAGHIENTVVAKLIPEEVPA